MARRRSRSTRTVPQAGSSSLAERWLGALRNNPVVAAIIVIATVAGAIIAFWDRTSDFYSSHIASPVSVAAINISAENAQLIDEQMMTCRRWDDKKVRTFSSSGASKVNHAVALDFVLTSASDQDTIVTGMDVEVSTADNVAGGEPGIVVPNHTYFVELEHDEGTQSFPLNPSYRIPPRGTGAFTVAFQPKEEGVGMCWIMKVVFNTNLGAASSEEISLIMSRFR